ncbi:unnamed protein product [Amoebophrya sp. A25]|nr:unnamed protein product [Amoebophrya sp. A25]|eukprot:GSA25T00011118001.1
MSAAPPSLLPGIQGLISRLEEIQVECGERPDELTKKKAPRDDFEVMKTSIYGMLHILRVNIRERLKITQKHGNNYQAIEKAVRIREMIAEIEKLLPKLQQIQMRQARQKRLNPEEIDLRVQDIRNICRQLEEAKIAISSNTDVGAAASSSSAAQKYGAETFLDDDEEADIFAGGSGQDGGRGTRQLIHGFERDKTGRDLNENEQEAIQRWKDRDANFDAMLDQIGVVCDRLNPLVAQIGETAQRQGVMANDIVKKVDKADADVGTMSGKIKHILQQERNSDFICKMVLFLVLLTVLGICAKMLNSNF